MQNSMVMLTFPGFDRGYIFWANLVQNIEIVSSRCNSILNLIQIFRIQRCCSLFSFSAGNTFFWANVVQNVKIVSLKANFRSYSSSNIQNSMMLFTFLFSTGSTLFGQIWSKKSELSA